MRSLITFVLVSLFSFSGISQQCCYGTQGNVCGGIPHYSGQTNRGSLYANTNWKSVTVTAGGKHYWEVWDTLYTAGDTRNVFIEFYTCSNEDLQLIISNTSQVGYADKRNTNNHNCGSNPYDEQWTHVVQQNQRLYLWLMGDSCNNTSGTFTLYYRVRCRTNSNGGTYALNNWRGHVFNKVDGNVLTTLSSMGYYADEPRVFTKDFGNTQPPVNGNCAMCPDSNRLDQDSFEVRYRMHYYAGRGYYAAVCSTTNNVRVNYHGDFNNGYDILRYPTNGGSYPVKANVHWLDSTDASFGNWIYYTGKDTGNLKADIKVVKMDGDLSFGNNVWSAYIYDTLSTIVGGPNSMNMVTYRGTFTETSKVFGYNFSSAPPTATGETGGMVMDNNFYHVWMKMRNNFPQGRYKFRMRSPAGGSLGFYNQSGTITQHVFNTSLGANTDITSAFFGLNGDTNLQYKFYKYTSNYPVSLNYCREPKNPGGIRVNSNALVAGNDTVCIGAPVTLTADTADGTETRWYIKSCLSSTGYIGSGASITVTPDSNTTYYVINRNLSVVSTDTVNKLDIYSPACASKRLIRITTPGAPTAPAAQTVCSDTSYTFSFDSVLAGSNGNQIEWSKRSSFDTSYIVSSGSDINVTVNAGGRDTIYFRSRVSATGCVSSTVNTTLTNNASPAPPTAPAAQSVFSDTTYLFTLTGITAGNGGNQIEWSKHNSFDTAYAVSSGSNISVTVNVGAKDTVWLRSKVSSAGCLSAAVYTTLTNNLKPVPPVAPANQSVDTDSDYTFTLIAITAGSGGNQVEWSRHSSFDTSYIVNSGSNIDVTVQAGVTDSIWLRSKISSTGAVSEPAYLILTNNLIPGRPMAPAMQKVCGDTTYSFIFQNIFPGDRADKVEWSRNSDFSNSVVINSGDSISLSVNAGQSDTVWLRSKSTSDNLVSRSVYTEAYNNIPPLNPTPPADQDMCSDNAYDFQFNLVNAGNGGDEVEWSTSKDFSSAYVGLSPLSFNLVVPSGADTTVWLRSKNSTTECVSDTVSTHVKVKHLPAAAISPADTTLLPGDTVILTASGGSFYYWPQFNSYSQSVTIPFDGIDATYSVFVQDDNSCARTTTSILRSGPSFGDEFTIGVSTTPITACSGYIDLAIQSQYNTTSSYQIVQLLPVGVIPDIAGCSVQINNTIYSYNSQYGLGNTQNMAGGFIVPSFSTSSRLLTWNIPGNYQYVGLSQNFTISIKLAVGCDYEPVGEIFTSIIMAGGTITQTNQLPTISTPSLEISGNPLIVTTASPSQPNLTQSVKFCNNGNAPVYDFQFMAEIDQNNNSVKILLKPSDANNLAIGNNFYLNNSNPLTTNPYTQAVSVSSNFGIPYLDVDQCFTAEITNLKAGLCNEDPREEQYSATIKCYNQYGPYAENGCNAVTAVGQIVVPGADMGLTIELTDADGDVNSTPNPMDICDEFSLTYRIFNNILGGYPNSTVSKSYDDFSVTLDPAWIEFGNNLSVTASDVNNTISNGYFTSNTITGEIKYHFPQSPDPAYINDGNDAIKLVISGLRIKAVADPAWAGTTVAANQLLVGTECSITNDLIINQPVVNYKTSCGVPNTSDGPDVTAYANTDVTLETRTYATGPNGENNPKVTVTTDPFIYFEWNQTPVNSDPYNIVSQNSSGPVNRLFNCDDVSYYAVLTLDDLVIPTTSTIIYEVDGVPQPNIQLHSLGSALHPSPWVAFLPGFGNHVKIGVECSLNYDNCRGEGRTTYPTLDIRAVCSNNNCPTNQYAYCFLHMENTLEVACRGGCGEDGGKGISTTALEVANLTNENTGDLAAYPCDMVQFKVSGAGERGNSDAPVYGATNQIILDLTYPNALPGSRIFDFNVPPASCTYNCPGIPGFPPLSGQAVINGQPTLTPDSRNWLVHIAITDPNICKNIREYGRLFSMSVNVPVLCDLPFEGNGRYDLNGIKGLLTFDVLNPPQLVTSCDPQLGGFTVFAHSYPEPEIAFTEDAATNPCSKVLVITDMATGENNSLSEMPNNPDTRPILSWPTSPIISGSMDPGNPIKISYPLGMTISGIQYSDNSGQAPTVVVIDPLNTSEVNTTPGTVTPSAPTITKIIGPNGGWRQFTKNEREFMRRLTITFDVTGCGPAQVDISLPHQQGPTSCYGLCKPWVTYTNTIAVPQSSASLSLSNDPYPFSLNLLEKTDDITIDYKLNNSTPLANTNITILPTFDPPGTPLPVVTISTINSNGDFTVGLSNLEQACKTKTISLTPHYTCAVGQPECPGTVSEIKIIQGDPNISLTLDPNGVNTSTVFADNKGICIDDMKQWSLLIKNASNAGPAYNPTFTLSDMGPGIMSIAEINFTYFDAGNVRRGSWSFIPTTPTNNFDSRQFTHYCPAPPALTQPDNPFVIMGLHQDNDCNPYLWADESVAINIRLYGDGTNCASAAKMHAETQCRNVCKGTLTTLSAEQDFGFPANAAASTCTTKFQFANQTGTCLSCSEGDRIQLRAEVINPSCNGANDGDIKIRYQGGTSLLGSNGLPQNPQFNFTWKLNSAAQLQWNGLDNPDPMHLAAGTYEVTVTSGNCTETLTVVLSNSGLVINTIPKNISCHGSHDGEINVTVAGGTAPYNFIWSDGATGENRNNLSPGTYTVSVSSLSTSNCTASSSTQVVLTDPASIQLGLSKQDIGCAGGNGSISVTNLVGNVNDYTYTWGGNIPPNTAITNPTLDVSVTGTYTVTVTDISDPSAQCSATASAIINTTLNAAPGISSPTVSVSLPVCPGSTFNITISNIPEGFESKNCTFFLEVDGDPNNPYTFTGMVHNGVFQINNFGPLAVGSHTIELTSITLASDASCALTFTTAKKQFDVSPAVNVNIQISGSNTVICNGRVVVLQMEEPHNNTYSWSFSNPPLEYNLPDGNRINAPNEGTYTVIGTDNFTGCTASASITVNKLDFEVEVSQSCPETSPIVLTANTTVSGNYTYQWDPANNPTRSIEAGANVIHYDVTVTEINSSCAVTATVQINRTPLQVSITASNGDFCSGQAVALFASPNPGPYTYSWSEGSSTAYTATVNPVNNPSTYTVTVTNTGNGCTGTGSLSVGVNSSPPQASLTASANSICSGESVTLTASGGSDYRWNTGLSGPISAITVNPTSTSTGNYSVTVSNGDNCTSSAAVSITVTPTITIMSEVTSVSCHGGSDGAIDISVYDGSGDYTYAWSWSNGSQTTEDINTLTAGDYTIMVTDNQNSGSCNSSTIFISVQEPDLLTATIPTSDVVTGCYNDSKGAIYSVDVQGGTEPYNFEWNNGATSEGNFSLAPGTYTVTVTDANSCSASTSVSLQPNELNPTLSSCYSSSVSPHYLYQFTVCLTSGSEGTPFANGQEYRYEWAEGGSVSSGNNSSTYLTNYTSIVSVTVTDGNTCTALAYNLGRSSAYTGEIEVELPCFKSLIGHGVPNNPYGFLYTNPNMYVPDNTPREFTDFIYTWYYSAIAQNITGQTISNPEPGTYNLSVYDGFGCVYSQIPPITVPETLVINSTAVQKEYDDANCTANNIGSIDYSTAVTGGTLPYTYTWSPAQTGAGAIRTNLSPGTYKVTITDVNGCSVTDQQVLEKTNSSCCVGDIIPNSNPQETYAFAPPTTLSDIAALNLPAGTAIVINGNFLVSASNPATVTLNNLHIYMGADASIQVDAGQVLNLNNTHIESCEMWQGMRVLGNSNQPQTPSNGQGVLKMNNCIIEDASIAVDNGGMFNLAGAIVQATGCTFRNNTIDVRDIQFGYKYRKAGKFIEKTASRFTNCNFITTEELNDATQPNAHAILFFSNSLAFNSCKFQNVRTDLTSSDQLGDGIYSLESNFSLDRRIGLNSPSSEFRNLAHGIFAGALGGISTFSVANSSFTNCIRGIRNESVPFCMIIGNRFVISDNFNLPDGNGYYDGIEEGIILYGSTGYKVQQNQFTSNAANMENIGIRTDNSGPTTNRIYNNKFTEMFIGNLANRSNRNGSSDDPKGLTYECNQNLGNYGIDFAVEGNQYTYPNVGINANQGTQNKSAGNSFTHSTTMFWPSDFINAAPTAPISYFYTGTSLTNPSTWVNPALITTNTITPVSIDPSFANTCPSRFTFNPTVIRDWTYSDIKDVFSHNKHEADIRSEIYTNIIDGGNTQMRMDQTNTYTNSAQLMDSLVAYSPNLSTKVLRAVAFNGNVLSKYQRSLILNANWEGVTIDLYNEWEDGDTLKIDFPHLTRSDSLTYRSYLLDTILYHSQLKDQALQDVLTILQDDSLELDIDLYRAWLDSTDELWAKQQMINSYLQEGNLDTIAVFFTKYDSLVHGVDSANFENYKDFILAYRNWRNTDSSLANLDSVQKSDLVNLANADEHGPGSRYARNVLNFFYDSLYFTEALLPNFSSAKRSFDDESMVEEPIPAETVTKNSNLSIRMYPNPAKDVVIIAYNGVLTGGKVIIVNALGVLVDVKTLPDGNGKLTLHTGTYANGIYLVRIEADGKAVIKDKLIILK